MGSCIESSSPMFMEETSIIQIVPMESTTAFASPTFLKEIVREILSVVSSSASSLISLKRINNEILHVGGSTASPRTFMEETDVSHILLTVFIIYLIWEEVPLLCMYPMGVL